MASSINFYSKALKSGEQATISRNHSYYSIKHALVSLRLEDLAQAREVLSLRRAPSRLGEGSSSGIVAYATSRSGKTSPERDYTSLKMKTSRLSDSSSRRSWANLC
ncbi:hypothetical protein DEO72_LG11g2241 [Vigna unguiculata]|uniref:Uncharacterized protein n=1 Tax=Vigna unguiculata TaxID=3917 RepID=A0A4D6NKR1_VIGUN|nr:hypothetical protein DEO72_LG11g1383 [Vigna unguiculata]QCE15232.1 hypothetical protein DEO72_LG11g2241 [Vigna unguiculata]